MKIERHKDHESKKEHDINRDTGDVKEVVQEPWNPKKLADYEKALYLVKKLEDGAINIIDESTVQVVAQSLACFGEKGRPLYSKVSLRQTTYDTEQLKDIYDKAVRTTKWKSPVKFINICRNFGIETIVGDEDYEYLLLEGKKPVRFTDEMTEDMVRDVQDYGFIELRNQYYFSERDSENKRITLTPKSKFIIRVLYHIHRGKNNKRVIILKNNRNEQQIMEIETKEINSLQSFKSLTEGVGYYVLDPSFKEPELQRVKNKIFAEEKASKQLEVLGWNKNNFFAFCNGLYDVATSAFLSVDEYGIVSLGGVHYHIPFHPGTDEYSYLNEKKIFYDDGTTTFEGWSGLYGDAFGLVGCTVLAFTVATVFSDHIFAVKNNFPLLFLYGEGGSGKGTVFQFAQRIFGQPQPPLKLTEKANTDKARVRKFATYCNLPIVMEEFSNSIDTAGQKTVTNLYDRFGYERSSMDTRYGTETVPIRSTVMITGNEYPSDDPLIQRCVLLDYNKNTRTDEEVNAFRKLDNLNQLGSTSVLKELLSMRSGVEKTWRKIYEVEYDLFRQDLAGNDPEIPGRMIENYAVLLATHVCLKQLGVKWPRSYDDLKAFYKKSLLSQVEKRSAGAALQSFWDIVLHLANNGLIHENKEFQFDGIRLEIRTKLIHMMYLREHYNIHHKQGLSISTLQQKLRDSPSFIEAVGNKKFKLHSKKKWDERICF